MVRAAPQVVSVGAAAHEHHAAPAPEGHDFEDAAQVGREPAAEVAGAQEHDRRPRTDLFRLEPDQGERPAVGSE